MVAAAPGLDGRVLLVDAQMERVLVVSPSGTIERLVGKPGEGPGEISGAYRAVQLADGRIGVAAGAEQLTFAFGTRGEIVFYDRSDRPDGVLAVAGEPGDVPMSVVRELRHAGGRILVATYRTRISPPRFIAIRELILLEPVTGTREVIARDLYPSALDDIMAREQDLFEPFASGRCDIDPVGRVAYAPERDRWLVAVREPDGSGFVVERSWLPVRRSPEAMERIEELLGGGDRCHPLDHEPAIGLVRWRPDGCLWVEPVGARLPVGAVACFDELAPDGSLRRRVYLEVSGGTDPGHLELLEDGRILLFEGFDVTGAGGADVDGPAVTLFDVPDRRGPGS